MEKKIDIKHNYMVVDQDNVDNKIFSAGLLKNIMIDTKYLEWNSIIMHFLTEKNRINIEFHREDLLVLTNKLVSLLYGKKD